MSSPQKADLGVSGFIWDCLSWGVVYLDYLGLIAFHIVNIISLTSAGGAFENLEKKFKLNVFVLSYKSQCEKMGTTENLKNLILVAN